MMKLMSKYNWTFEIYLTYSKKTERREMAHINHLIAEAPRLGEIKN